MKLSELHKLIDEEIEGRYILKQLETDFPIQLELYDKGTHLELDKIVVPGGKRGVGIGSEVLTKITDYADKTSQPIFLTPSTSYGGTSVRRLENFYKRFGFERSKDSSLSRNKLVRFPE